MSKVLIIDDSDPAITYTGNWATLSSVGIQTREYNSTVHQSSTAGDQLSYTFEGTGITVYGTLDAPGINGSPSPTFSIDGKTPTGFSVDSIVGLDPNVISSYVPLYTTGNLTKGTHILAISSSTPPNTSIHLYVDFLVVDTGSDSGSGNIIVDDRDPSITYVGNWQNQGDQWEYDLTTSRSPSDVAGGTATFRFNGTSTTIYGTTGLSIGANTTASIMFAVDGGTGTTFHSPQNSSLIQHNTLFHVAGLSNTQEHTIVMTSLDTKGWNLDYMVYTTWNSSISGGGGGSSVTGSETGGGGPNVGVVAGGVVTGVVALLAIAGIIFIHLRRSKRKSNEEFNDKSVAAGTGSHSGPSPFTPPATGPHVHANPLSSKQYGSNNFHGSALTDGARGRMGRGLLDSSTLTSYQGTQSLFSDGDSRQVLTPAVSGPAYRHQTPNNTLYPRFDRGAGEGNTSTYQRDNGQDYDQGSGQPSGDKARYIGRPVPFSISAINTHCPPPSGVPSIEEDSEIRIPSRAPPAYTPD